MEWSGTGGVEVFFPSVTILWMPLNPFVKRNAVVLLNLRSISCVVPIFEHCNQHYVNMCAFRCGMHVSIDDVTIFNDVTHVCVNVHEEAKAMLLHARCVCVGELDAHAYKLLTIHACACSMGAVTLMAVIPDGADDFRCGRYATAFGSGAIHSIGVVFI
jgi:hypothetical protein